MCADGQDKHKIEIGGFIVSNSAFTLAARLKASSALRFINIQVRVLRNFYTSRF